MSTTARIALVAIASLVVLAVGLHLWQRPTSRLLVVGDSVTFMSAQAIDGALDRRIDLDAVAQPGYTTAALLPLAVDAMDRLGPDVPVALLVGYNDVIQGNVEEPALERLVARSAEQSCAVWLALPTADLATEGPGVATELARRWNERMAALVAEHPDAHLVTEWAELVERFGPGELVAADGVHPTEAGSRALGRVISDHVEERCGDAGG